ncbi:phosphoribosyltransferase family protein [Bdellovibrionota bacterium FG-1]
MLLNSFICPACRQPSGTLGSFPLCELCVTSLIPAPALCPHCAGVECAQAPNCLRPWMKIPDPPIDSFWALYLLVGPGYRVLRRWKINRGIGFNRQILKPTAALRAQIHAREIDAVIPIPQRFSRSWALNGSPAETLASWISSFTAIPHLSVLSPFPSPQQPKRQAELKINERLQNPLKFGVQPNTRLTSESKILLVDDFMTSGHTLRAAAQALRNHGIGRTIHAFSLGVRPQNTSHLLDRRSRTIAIGHKE